MEPQKYATTRVTAGDYVVPSNDANCLWRIHQYREDGSAFVYVEADRQVPLTGKFWAVYRSSFPVAMDTPLGGVWDDWDKWECHGTGYRTKKEALGSIFSTPGALEEILP